MKRFFAILLAVLTAFSLSACTANKPEPGRDAKGKPVKVITLEEETNPDYVEYFGIIKPEDIKNMGFESSGKIAEILVKKGDNIKNGTVIARLDTEEIGHAVSASTAQLDAARAQLAAAQDAYDFAVKTFERTESLYNAGSASQSAYDEAKLNRDVRQSELDRARQLANQAAADYRNKLSLLDNSVLTADMDGYVVDVLYKAGEIIAAGHPLAVIRGDRQVANIGLARKDAAEIHVGAKANVDVDGTVVEGRVTSISQVPDSQILTYSTDILLEGGRFLIGATARVSIFTGETRGIRIPVSSIMSDGIDYVFVADGDIASKRKVTVEGMRGSHVTVEGLKSGDRLIVEGARRLKDGDRLIIQE